MTKMNRVNYSVEPRDIPDTDEGNLRLYYELELLRSNYESERLNKQLNRYIDTINVLAERGHLVDFSSDLEIDKATRKADWPEPITKPFGPFKSFGACMSHMTRPKSKGGGGYSKEKAQKVCGKMQAELGEKWDDSLEQTVTEKPALHIHLDSKEPDPVSESERLNLEYQREKLKLVKRIMERVEEYDDEPD